MTEASRAWRWSRQQDQPGRGKQQPSVGGGAEGNGEGGQKHRQHDRGKQGMEVVKGSKTNQGVESSNHLSGEEQRGNGEGGQKHRQHDRGKQGMEVVRQQDQPGRGKQQPSVGGGAEGERGRGSETQAA
eukprot:gene27666-7307_t